MPNATEPRQAAAGDIGAWARRSVNPLRMAGDVVSTFDTISIERDMEWAKAGHAALRSRASADGIPLVRNGDGELAVEASIESVRRCAMAAHADGHLSDEALREILAMTPRQFRAWCRLQGDAARKRSNYFFVLSGLAVLVAAWSVLVVGSSKVGLLAGLTWLLLALVIALYGWRERREVQGRGLAPGRGDRRFFR